MKQNNMKMMKADRRKLNELVIKLKEANLTRQEFRTLIGQATSGNIRGAEKGLNTIKERKDADRQTD